MPDGLPAKPGKTASLANLANIITFGRLCAVPLAFWLVLVHRIGNAFLLFVAAMLSAPPVRQKILCSTPCQFPQKL